MKKTIKKRIRLVNAGASSDQTGLNQEEVHFLQIFNRTLQELEDTKMNELADVWANSLTQMKGYYSAS
jgi:hypothetical protein